jgi:hypothetical protein
MVEQLSTRIGFMLVAVSLKAILVGVLAMLVLRL